MQVNQVSHIELIWPNGKSRRLDILQPVALRKKGLMFEDFTYGNSLIYTDDKPTHFIWYDPDARPVTQKMRNWVADVFPQIFNPSNKLLLFASIGTAPLELREQLKDLFNEQTIIHG